MYTHYLSPGNESFRVKSSYMYIDKTGMLSLLNGLVDTPCKAICVSRPRRFGNSFAAQMVCAYYDASCDSKTIFQNLAISKDPSYSEYLNQFNVVFLDPTSIKPYTDDYSLIGSYLTNTITEEIRTKYPDVNISGELGSTLLNLVERTGRKIVMVIDEWDAPIRENPKAANSYLTFLRSLFKSDAVTDRVFALVYMTGILPIPKNSSGSALTNFWEATAFDPGDSAECFGFTKDEVASLFAASGKNLDIEAAMKWYDGYNFGTARSLCNPYSVMSAVLNGYFKAYWSVTSAVETLKTYIELNINGLHDSVAALVSGSKIKINPLSFRGGTAQLNCADDVLTLLVHLGYLTYEPKSAEEISADADNPYIVYIPNIEVRKEFEELLKSLVTSE